LLEADYGDHGQGLPPGHMEALTAALGHARAIDVRRDHLDALVRTWRQKGIAWPGRDPKRVGPVSGATCNRITASLRRAYSLGREKLGLVTALTFPHLRETARGKAIPPGHTIWAHPGLAEREPCL
jgi:hypothetical protein